MTTYQMPCLRKAASQSRLSTSLTMMKRPTQVSWTVKTVPGMGVSSCKCLYKSVCAPTSVVLSTHAVNRLRY